MNQRIVSAAGSRGAQGEPAQNPTGPRHAGPAGETRIDPVELGRRIRQTRLELRLTLKQMEQVCELSATHISEIERGRTSPTVGALTRLARSLGREAAYFMDPEERADVSHVTAHSTPPLDWASGVTVEPLSLGIPGSRIFPYRLRIEAGAGVLQLSARDDSNAAYTVERGTLALTIGERQLTVGAGEAVHGSRAQPHVLRAAASDPIVVLAILSHALEERT